MDYPEVRGNLIPSIWEKSEAALLQSVGLPAGIYIVNKVSWKNGVKTKERYIFEIRCNSLTRFIGSLSFLSCFVHFVLCLLNLLSFSYFPLFILSFHPLFPLFLSNIYFIFSFLSLEISFSLSFLFCIFIGRLFSHGLFNSFPIPFK